MQKPFSVPALLVRCSRLGKIVLPILMLLLLCFTTVHGLSQDLGYLGYSYRVEGYYEGLYELVASGSYKSTITGDPSDLEQGFLRITYKVRYVLNILINEYEYRYVYVYTLLSFNIKAQGFSRGFVNSINLTLLKYVNKTKYEVSRWVKLPIVLKLNLTNGSIYFENAGKYYSVTGISLYNDVVCFEYATYHESIVNSVLNRLILSLYYDPLSGTPLYFYKYESSLDLYNDKNFMYTKQVVVENGVSLDLSKVSRSIMKNIYFSGSKDESEVARLGVIYYGRLRGFSINCSNKDLYLRLDTLHPYRVVLIIDSYTVSIDYSSLKLREYSVRNTKIYVSPVMYRSTEYTIAFNKPIKLPSRVDNKSLIREVTIEEREYSSIYVYVYSLVFNVLVLLGAYYLCRAIAKIAREALKD